MKASTLFLIGSVLLTSAFVIIVSAQPKPQKLKTTANASDKYGPGGTLETTSDEKLKVVKEVWKDNAGEIRETHIYQDKDGKEQQVWNFFKAGDYVHAVSRLSIFYTEATEEFKSPNMPAPDPIHVTKAKVEQWVEKIETQFAKDGTILEPWYEVKTTVEQPKLPPTEVFNKPKTDQPSAGPNRPDPLPADVMNPPKTTTTQPKKEEPKKEEPKKGETPKTEKTSTGGSSVNNELTTSFTAPGYNVENKTEFGLNRVTFTTPTGKMTVNIPADWQPGEPATGSVWFDPSGQNDKERDKNARELEKYSFDIPHVNMNAPEEQRTGMLRIIEMNWKDSLARDQVTQILNSLGLRYNDKTVVRTALPPVLQPAPPPTSFTIPTGIQQGGFGKINGPFNGLPDGSTKIGDTLVPTIAESHTTRIVWNTSKSLVPTIEITDNGQTGQCPFHNVGVSVSATNLRLLRGQTATVTVTFTGLGKLNQDIPYDLVNHSPEVISMQGAEEAQNRTIPYTMIANPEDAKGGTYTDHVTITGVAPGPFRITATVRWKETCNLPPNAMHKQ
jgi:hypothetical protein